MKLSAAAVCLGFVAALLVPSAARAQASPQALRRMADDYYRWRDRNYPVASSDQGLHTWDDKLTDYRPAAVQLRRRYVADLLARVKQIPTARWAKDDRVDWLLFRAQLENVNFFDRVLQFDQTNPQTYVDECSNAIFSLLKKEYAAPRVRAIAATARLRQMPALLEDGKRNLTRPVKLYAQLAIDSARSIDSLFNDSLMTLAQDPAMTSTERTALTLARDRAVTALHAYADWLQQRVPGMVAFAPMGEANYNYLLKHVYLLPLDARQVEMLGQSELARYQPLEHLAAVQVAQIAHIGMRCDRRCPIGQCQLLQAPGVARCGGRQCDVFAPGRTVQNTQVESQRRGTRQCRRLQSGDRRIAAVGCKRRFELDVDGVQVAQQRAVRRAVEPTLQQDSHHAAALGLRVQGSGAEPQAFSQCRRGQGLSWGSLRA